MRDLVVIGGSLGDMKTLCRLIDRLPSPFRAPILAVLHAASDGPASPDRMLADCTAMPVSFGADGDVIKAGRVYLAPSDRHLVVTSPGILGLAAGIRGRAAQPAADHLFESAARVYGPRVIGVVLVGGGEDGAAGLRAINAAGGIGVFQAAEETVFSGDAPSAPPAWHSHSAHYRLPLDDIAELLRKLIDGEEAPLE